MKNSVLDFGAYGDGIHDDYSAFQSALDNCRDIYIPQGIYNISGTLKLHPDTTVVADKCAKIVMKSLKRRQRNEFLLSATDVKNIKISGGIWDGLNTLEYNAKPDLFDKSGYSGALLNFVGVNGLTLSDMVLANSVTFYSRFCRIHNFTIENIDLVSDSFGKNQDGLHFGGDVRHGTVKNLRALSFGQTNDDMIALNADDSIERVENLDLCRDVIEDITFENIFTESCHTIIRMLSVHAPIRNIRFKNVYGGFRCNAINADAARYCKTPLFCDEDYSDGVGDISDIYIENFTCFPVCSPEDFGGTRAGRSPLKAITLESNSHNFTVKNFRYIGDISSCPAIIVKNVTNRTVTADGKQYSVKQKTDALAVDNFNNLTIN